MHFIKDIKRFVNDFYKLATLPKDVLVYTYIPSKAIEYVREKGLLSAVEIIEDKKALRLARPDDTKEYIKRTKEHLNDPEWQEFMHGISAFFTLPDFKQINKKHNIFKFDLIPVKINLSQLIKDQPKTRLHGVELELFNPKAKSQPNREKIISLKEVRDYTLKNPEQLWKNYNNPGNKMYAPDVPHLIIITPSNKISAKYILS